MTRQMRKTRRSSGLIPRSAVVATPAAESPTLRSFSVRGSVGLAALLSGSTQPATAQLLVFAVSGNCSEEMTVTFAGATASGSAEIYRSLAAGTDPVPSGPCAGTELGLTAPRRTLTLKADANGGLSQAFAPPPTACGHLMQLVDLTSCTVSNVAYLASGYPAPVPRTGQRVELRSGRRWRPPARRPLADPALHRERKRHGDRQPDRLDLDARSRLRAGALRPQLRCCAGDRERARRRAVWAGRRLRARRLADAQPPRAVEPPRLRREQSCTSGRAPFRKGHRFRLQAVLDLFGDPPAFGRGLADSHEGRAQTEG